MSFLFILIQPSCLPCWLNIIITTAKRLGQGHSAKRLAQGHSAKRLARAEIQLQLNMLPGSLLSPRETLPCDPFYFAPLSSLFQSSAAHLRTPPPVMHTRNRLSLALSRGPSRAPTPITPRKGLPENPLLNQNPIRPMLEIQVTTLFNNPTTPFYPRHFPFPRFAAFQFSPLVTKPLVSKLTIFF